MPIDSTAWFVANDAALVPGDFIMAFHSGPSIPHPDFAGFPVAYLPAPSNSHGEVTPAAVKPKRRKSLEPHFCEPSADGGFVLSDPDGRVWGVTRKRKRQLPAG
ncbi:MAG: hypothetical protein WBE03_04505 [Terracidiphilus sp.]